MVDAPEVLYFDIISFIFIKLKSNANIIKDCNITKFISNYLLLQQSKKALFSLFSFLGTDGMYSWYKGVVRAVQ